MSINGEISRSRSGVTQTADVASRELAPTAMGDASVFASVSLLRSGTTAICDWWLGRVHGVPQFA